MAKATTGNGKYGLLSAGDTLGSHYIYSAILNNGGALFTPDRKFTLASDRNVEAIQAFADMVKDGSVSPASAGYSSDDALAAFYRGDGAFLLNTPGLIDGAAAQKANIGIVPPMAGPHGDKGTIFWVNNIMVYQQTKHPEEVKTFLKWWSKNQKALWTQGTCGQLPVRKSIAADPYFSNNAALAQIISQYVPLGKTTGYGGQGHLPRAQRP